LLSLSLYAYDQIIADCRQNRKF